MGRAREIAQQMINQGSTGRAREIARQMAGLTGEETNEQWLERKYNEYKATRLNGEKPSEWVGRTYKGSPNKSWTKEAFGGLKSMNDRLSEQNKQRLREYDVNAGQTLIDKKTSERDALMKEREELDAIQDMGSALYNVKNSYGSAKASQELKKRIDALKDEISSEQYMLTKAKRQQADDETAAYIENLRQNDSAFERKVNLGKRNAEEFFAYKPNTYGDGITSTGADKRQAADIDRYNNLSDQEKTLYHYYMGTNKKAADKYLESLKPDLNARVAESLTATWQKEAEENPVGASIASIATNLPFSGLEGAVYSLTSAAFGKEIDPNSEYFTANRATNAYRNTVAGNIEKNVGGSAGQALSFLYNTGMSMADSAFMPITGGVGLAGMGVNAGTDTIKEAKERGASNEQALIMGGIAAVAETLFEKVSLDSLIKLSSPAAKNATIKNILKQNILKQSFTEAREETLTEITNIIADTLVMGDLSNYNTAVKAYMAQGMGEEEARKQATIDTAKQIGLAALGGGLSGGAFGAAGSGVSNIRTRQLGANIIDSKQQKAVIDRGLSTGEGTRAYELAKQNEKKATKTSIGRQYMANLEAVQQETNALTESMRKAGASEAEINTATNAVYKVARGGVITEKEASALLNNDNAWAALGKLTGIVTKPKNNDAKLLANSINSLNGIETKKNTTAKSADIAANTLQKSAETPKLRVAATNMQTGAEAEITSIASIENGEILASMSDGSKANIANLDIDPETRTVINNAKRYGAEAANSITAGFAEFKGTAAEYNKQVADYYAAGRVDAGQKTAAALSAARNAYYGFAIPEYAANAAYRAGVESKLAKTRDKNLPNSGFPTSIENLDADEKKKTIKEFAEYILSGANTDDRIIVGKVPERLSKAVYEKSGVDISGFDNVLMADGIRHGAKHDESTGNVKITSDDVANFVDVFDTFDDVIVTKKRNGEISIKLEKEIDGRLYYVALVGRKKGWIYTKNMWKKSKTDDSSRRTDTNNAPAVTSKTAAYIKSSNNNIPQTPKENNPDIQDSVEVGTKSGANKNKGGLKQEAVKAVQSIPRKSVNKFTGEEIRKTEKYAAQYWREMGTKSPFFRAWFGDWRANDKTPVTVATKKGDTRGAVKNADTGWDINVSSKVFNETKSHKQTANQNAVAYLPYINDIVKNAVLLDTCSVGDKTKSPNTLLMHSLYAVADIGNGKELLKLYVEEMNDPNADGTAKRAYQLQNIESWQLSAKGSGNSPSPVFSTANIESVSNLFAAVKSKDKSFNPKPSSKVVDEDGKPLVVYHGTSKVFTEFKIGDIGYHVGSRDQAESRIRTSDNKVVMPLYISLTNPLEIGMDYGNWGGTNVAIMLLETEVFEDRPDIEEKLSEILEIDRAKNGMSASQRKDRAVKELLQSLGYDGIVYNNTFEGNNRYSGENYSYIAFEPNQIKSAENNIGTFDSENDDIQYSAEPYSAFDPDKKWKTERVGKERKAERLSDIVKDIEKKFGIPITKARVVKGASGTYNTHTQAIRTKVENNLPTIAHELGHHIDNKYSEMKSGKKYRLTSNLTKELRAELIAGADPKFLEQYSPDKHTSEAFAEFMRQYLQNRETARIDYPAFFEYFESKLSKQDLEILKDLADRINAIYSMPDEGGAMNAMVSEATESRAQRFVKSLKDLSPKAMYDSAYQSLIDNMHGIKLFDAESGADTYTLARNSQYADSRAAYIMEGDKLMSMDGTKEIGESLGKILRDAGIGDKKIYEDFGYYLIMCHGPEYLKQGKRVFANDRQNSTNYMEMEQKRLEEKYPHFEETARRLYNFQRNLVVSYGIEGGLISPNDALALFEKYPCYVPFYRKVEKSGGGIKKAFSGQKSVVKRAKGSGLEIINPIESIFENTAKWVVAASYNKVAATISAEAAKMEAGAAFMERMPDTYTPKKLNLEDLKAQIRANLEATGADADTVEGVYETALRGIETALIQFDKSLRAKGDEIIIMRGGNMELWKVHDHLLLDSLTKLAPQRAEGFAKLINNTTKFMAANVTGLNVVWSVASNMPRDIITSYVYSGSKDPRKLLKGIAESYVNKFKEASKNKEADPIYQLYLAMGGGSDSFYSADVNMAKKVKAKIQRNTAQKIAHGVNPLNWLEVISDTVEAGPRYAEFKIRIEQGYSPAEAFYFSREVTVDFRRGGNTSKMIGRVVPFFNASVQGIDRFARWLTAEDVKGERRKMAVKLRASVFVGVSIALGAIMYALNSSNDEDKKYYEQLSAYTKNNFFCIPIGDGQFFTIPKPREQAFLTSAFERVFETVGGNDEAFADFGEYTRSMFLPPAVDDLTAAAGALLSGDGEAFGENMLKGVGSLGVLGAAVQCFSNKDFLGKPIVSSSMEGLEPKLQYDARTSKLAKALGEAGNISPKQIDHFCGQVFGGFWKWQKALFPIGEENTDYTLGVKNSYIRDSQYSTDLVNTMYELRDKASVAKNSDPGDIEKAQEYDECNTMATFYTRYYSLAKKDSGTSEQTRSERQTVLDMIREFNKCQKKDYRTSQQKKLDKIIKETENVGLLPDAMQTAIKEGRGEKKKEYSLSSGQYLMFQTDYNRLYWLYVGNELNKSNPTEEKIKKAKSKALEEAKKNAIEKYF